MKILFKKVTIRNFLSFGNIPTEFEYSTGINIVTGQNLDNGTRNGVGKSSLLVDSISFAIYGKTLRGEHVNRDEIVNEINKKNCEVTVEFYIGSDEYIVTRTIKPNSFTVFENGNEIKFDTMKNTERWLEEKIGISHTCFSNILVLNMNDTEPFLTMDASHKREVIEDVLNLNIFGRMSDIAKDRHLEAKNNVRTYENDVKSSSETLELAKNSRDNILREKEKFETEKNNKILLLENDIKKLISNKDSLESKIDTNDYVAILNDLSLKQDKVKEIIQSCKSRITELTNENIKIKDAVDSIENMPVCPKCHTPNPINNELVKNFIEGEKVKFDNNIKEISSKKEILEKSNIILKSLNDKIKENNENKTKQTDLNNELMIINNNLANKQKLLIEESMRVLTIENVISDDDIKKYSEKYDDVSKLYKDASKSFQFNSLLRKILGEEGIRKFVVSKVLPYFNSKINGYLKIMGSDLSLRFDSNLDEQIITRNREERRYGSFSAGEKKRIDISVLLSLMDLAKLQNSVDTNILILDEVLDTAMDNEGIENFLNYLKSGFKSSYPDKSVYIITHRNTISDDFYDTMIKLTKKDGFTSIDNIIDLRKQ